MPAITTIKFRRGTAAQWATANPVLAAGEMGVETDTRKFKFGTGSAQWNSIAYASSGGSGSGGGFFVAETSPVGANIGDIWYCSGDTGDLAGKSFIRYDGYWVELNPGTLGPKGTDGAAGAAGADGADGLSFNFQGQWDGTDHGTYYVNDVVTYNGSAYICITQVLDNVVPTSSPAFALLVAQGDIGATGPQGDPGAAGESGVLTPVAVSSDITLASKNRYFVDTFSYRTLTLPAAPAVGDEIQIFDASGNAGTKFITVLNNSQKINGVTDTALLDVNGVAAVFIYTGSTYGWRLG